MGNFIEDAGRRLEEERQRIKQQKAQEQAKAEAKKAQEQARKEKEKSDNSILW